MLELSEQPSARNNGKAQAFPRLYEESSCGFPDSPPRYAAIELQESNFKADGSHQFEGIAFLDHSFHKTIIKSPAPVFNMVLKMHI